MKKLLRIFSADWAIAGWLFLVAAAIRTIPEIKAGVWPIGYDTFNTYAAEIASYHGPLINWLKTANVLYFLFWPVQKAGVEPDLIIKIFGPLLFGALSVSFFYFARHFLKFSKLKAFLLVLLTMLQLATLRLSWDLYRNELGLIFLFWGLIYLPKIRRTKNLLIFSLLGGLVALSNELVTVVLLIILSVYGVYLLIKKQWEEIISLGIILVIIAILFTIVISSSGQVLYDPHVFFTSEQNYFWRYFYHYNAELSYDLLKTIIGQLFWLLYGWLLPLAVIGFWYLRKNLILGTLTLWLLFGTFSSLIFMGNGLIVWERWIILLVFPLVIYATEGIFQLGRLLGRIGHLAAERPKLAIALAIIFWLGFLGLFVSRALPFLTADYQDAKPPLSNELINNYFPRTMILTSIGYRGIDDTVKAIEWLNQQAPPGSVILVDNRYRGVMLTHFEVDNRFIITNPWSETIQSSSLETVKKTNYWPIYLIWNVSRSVDGFDRIYNVGERGIYQALPEFRNQ